MITYRLIFFLAIFGLLTACQVLPASSVINPPLSGDRQQNPQESLYDMNSWQLEGKIGYRTLQQHGSARISWRQDGDQFDVYLSALFGINTTRIHGTSELAEMTQSDKNTFSSASVAELTRHLLGFSLPLKDMLWWVRGLPAQDKDIISVQYYDNGLLNSLDQSGWQLTFDNYMNQDGRRLPGRIRAWRHDIQFTMVIYQWQPR